MAAVPYTLAALQAELSGDPASLGYATPIAAGQDQDVCNLVNSITTTAVNLNSMPRGSFVLALCVPCMTLATLSAGIQSKWDRILGLLSAADPTIPVSSTVMQELFAGLIADGVMPDQGAVNAIIQRPGTRAEVLWGTDTVVSLEDVSAALNALSPTGRQQP